MLAFFNFSNEPQTFRTSENLEGLFEYHDMMTGETFKGDTITLEGFGFLWLLANL